MEEWSSIRGFQNIFITIPPTPEFWWRVHCDSDSCHPGRQSSVPWRKLKAKLLGIARLRLAPLVMTAFELLILFAIAEFDQ